MGGEGRGRWGVRGEGGGVGGEGGELKVYTCSSNLQVTCCQETHSSSFHSCDSDDITCTCTCA